MTTEVNAQPNNEINEQDMDVDTPEQNPVNDDGEDNDDDFSKGWKITDDIYIPPPPQVFGEYDTKGPRLMLVKIVAKNFKSYAESIEIGPFHKCFSSIVGPNGNGKSNAIDSMLFVFGYRSNKIRTKKVSELIHHSNEFPNCSSCTVSVYFQQIIDKPGQDYDIIPNSEFVISRTAFKDSSAYYELNGKKVQFKQIAQLLRSHHVDLDHNRFLILQGEVEQIALMKPKGQTEGDTGMLEFLEDIIGTNRYKEPLQKLNEKVEFLTELREEKVRRLKVVEKAKIELEKPMQEAVQYLKGENTIIRLQHKLYQCKHHETSEQLREEEESKKELDEDYNKLMEEMKSVQGSKEEKSKEFKEKSKKWDKLQQQKDGLTCKFDEIRKKDEALHAESVASNKRRKDNMNTVKNERSKLEELLRVPEKNKKDIKECESLHEKNIADREKEEAALATLMSGLKEKTEPLMKKRSVLEKELVVQRKSVDETKSAYEIAKSKLDIYTSEEQTEKRKLEELKEAVKTTGERLAVCKRNLSTIEPKIPATEKSLREAQNDLEQLKAQENDANMRLRGARVKFDEQKSAMQAGKSRNHILNALMAEKREGRIPGILGRLGDLGAIDAKYDIAISTACGPLDNIVVDTFDTGKNCIEFLRRNNIGRATFIALDKQQYLVSKCREKIRTPENVHRLFDLIKVENEQVLPAFYYAIRDTLVADEIEQATRIGLQGAQRFRVVTLRGELVDPSGTMTGGGRNVSRGRMGQKVARSEPTSRDIEKLQNELDQVFEEYNNIKLQQPALENQIHTLSTALRDMVEDRDKLKTEISQLSINEPNLRKQLQVQQKKSETTVCDPAKVHQMKKVIEEAEAKLNEVSKNSKETETEVARINQEIEEISGGRVKEQQKKISALTKAIDKTKGEICRLQVAIKTAERNSKKSEQRIETLETEIKNCEHRIKDILKEKAEFEEVGKSIMQELKQLNEDLSERDELAGQFKSELDKLQSRESKIKSVKIDMDQKMSEKIKTLKELRSRIPDLLKLISNLKLQEIPNEDTEPLAELTKEELEEIDSKTVAAQLQKAKEKLPAEIPNMQIIEQYKEQNALYMKRSEKLQKITEERNQMRDSYNIVVRKRMQEFTAGFTLIAGKLKEMYRMITLGGDAELELVDSLDPFSEGIVFSVRPPKKSWKYIQNLSGGEKTLSSLALIFALHHYKPTPVYFMDEIDAALDFKNVSIVASYIKERTENAQFIVISHRSDMFELSDYLVGIYKLVNCSKCAVVDMKKFSSKVGIVENNRNNITHSRPTFRSQPNPIPNTFNTNNENRHEIVQARPVQIPATCPQNISKDKENEKSNDNAEKENENGIDNDADSSLRLGDISLPPTPRKEPQSVDKKRVAEKIPTPRREKSAKRTTEVNLEEVAVALVQHTRRSAASNVEVTPRRTPRTLKKEKLSDGSETLKPSLRERRKK